MTKRIDEYISSDKIKKAVILETDYNGYAIDFYVDDEYSHSSYYPYKNLKYISEIAQNYILDIFHPKCCPRKETNEL